LPSSKLLAFPHAVAFVKEKSEDMISENDNRKHRGADPKRTSKEMSSLL
jgi:hypothetical protein